MIYGPELVSLVRSLPVDGRSYAVATGVLSTRWGLATVAVGPVVPSSASFPPVPQPARILVVSKLLDQTVVDRLSQDFLIDGLRLVPKNVAAPERSVAIVSP